jgi:hypothetical protein
MFDHVMNSFTVTADRVNCLTVRWRPREFAMKRVGLLAALGLIGSLVAPAAAQADGAIVVTNVAELERAMTPANAGRTIRVRAQAEPYLVTRTLVVPDRASVIGDGQMEFDCGGLPTGFAPGARTTLRADTTLLGDFITMGDGSKLRGLAIEDAPRSGGNVVSVFSRTAFDSLSAEIVECELVNPNLDGMGLDAPTGRTVAAVTRTIQSQGPPFSHEGSALDVRIARSILRSSNNGSGVLAFNFAPRSHVAVTLSHNIVGGGISANGGVSRPLEVSDSAVEIESRHNLYRSDGPAANPARNGWQLLGGSGPPVGISVPATSRNTLRLDSAHDRVEGFVTGIIAAAARRSFPEPTAGPSSHNRVELELSHTRFSTQVTDFRLFGAQSTVPGLTPGDHNQLRLRARGVTGGGPRANAFGHAVDPNGELDPSLAGVGNRLEIEGTLRAFERRNRDIDPAPGPQFFTDD